MFLLNFEELGVIKLTGENILKIGKGKLISKKLFKEHKETGQISFYNKNDLPFLNTLSSSVIS